MRGQVRWYRVGALTARAQSANFSARERTNPGQPGGIATQLVSIPGQVGQVSWLKRFQPAHGLCIFRANKEEAPASRRTSISLEGQFRP